MISPDKNYFMDMEISRDEFDCLLMMAQLNERATRAGYISHEHRKAVMDEAAGERRAARRAKMKAIQDQMRQLAPISGTLET